MPIVMSYMLQRATHPNSFWVISGLNINVAMKTCTLVMLGYDTQSAFETDPTHPLDVRNFNTSSPALFDAYVGAINRAGGIYETTLMNWLQIGSPPGFLEAPTFFSGANVYSPVTFASAEIGFNPTGTPGSDVQLFVTFTDPIDTAGNYTTDVTIMVNVSGVSLSSASCHVNTKSVLFTLPATLP